MLGSEGGGVRVRYWLTLVSGLVECLCFAGAVFGWASLVFVLKSDGYFSYLCVNKTVNGTITEDCSGQDEQLSIIFTVASFMNNFFTLPNGFLFDHCGTLVTRLVGISIYTTGTLLIAFSDAALSILLYPALSFIAVGGILFLVTNMQVGNLFGTHRSTIITLYNGAFDSSSAVFLVVKLLFQDGISLRASLIFLSSCSVVHLIRTFLLMPRSHIPYPLPENYSYGLKCGKAQSPIPKNRSDNGNIQTSQPNETTPFNANNSTQASKTETAVSERSFKSCILSWFFFWHLLWLSVMQLRHYLFIGTLNPMLNRLTEGDPALVSTYTNAFAITQLCGILCAPWNGLIMDRNKGKPREEGQSETEADMKAAILSLCVTALQCVLFSLCAAIPVLPLQYLTFILQVLNRSFLYGGNAAFISMAFPSAHFGKLYGTVMALSAVVSLLQYPCFALVNGPLGGNPFAVNVALTVLSCLAFIHPFSVYLYCRHQAAELAKKSTSS
ncbi:solute carrier family 43 member 3b isoform X1 [Salminus brasiliensis]|uniref:solute carrier family 43 member 3b isoform X1 n=1 Tax=Salminus brasiliensis TaxID=930266 RepID=UPI003B83995E